MKNTSFDNFVLSFQHENPLAVKYTDSSTIQQCISAS